MTWNTEEKNMRRSRYALFFLVSCSVVSQAIVLTAI